MKHNHSLRLVICVLFVMSVAPIFAQMPQPFSADFTSTGHNGEKMTGKWFFAAPRIRVDMNSMPGRDQGPMAGPMSMIMDGTTQTQYMLMHGPHMYMEFHGERQNSMSPAMRDLLHQKGGADP